MNRLHGPSVPWRSKRHPVFAHLKADGRHMGWLARRTGYSHSHVRGVAAGLQPAGPVFRARCADLLGLEEAELFVQADTSSAAPASEDGASNRAGAAVLGAVYGGAPVTSRRSA